MWLPWSTSSACYCNAAGIKIPLPFIALPSNRAKLCLKVHYGQMSHETSFLFNGQLLMMYSFSCYVWPPFWVAHCISSIDMHASMSFEV